MSSLKIDVNTSNKRVPLNTTIDKEIFEAFKVNCKITGIPMNVLIETFMAQYNNGEFNLKFGRNKRDIDIDLNDDSETLNVGTDDTFGEIVDVDEV